MSKLARNYASASRMSTDLVLQSAALTQVGPHAYPVLARDHTGGVRGDDRSLLFATAGRAGPAVAAAFVVSGLQSPSSQWPSRPERHLAGLFDCEHRP